MSALFSQYPGFTTAVDLAASAVPASHGASNAGAKAFRASFTSRELAEAAVKPLQGYLMQPGWEMSVSVE